MAMDIIYNISLFCFGEFLKHTDIMCLKFLFLIFFIFGVGISVIRHKYWSISARQTLILGNYIEVRTVLFDDWIEGREGHPGTGC